MHFEIDGRRYVVAVASRPLLQGGEPCEGRTDAARRYIWLSDQLPRIQRRRVLMHELRHAWVFTRGRPLQEEADADHIAEMMDVLIEQYNQQGGDATLEALEPSPEPSITRAMRGPATDSAQACGLCGARIAPGSIHSGKPEWSADRGGWSMPRGMFCEICDCVTVWQEASTAEGFPLGTVLQHPKPDVLRGAAAGQWLREHESVYAGVVQV